MLGAPRRISSVGLGKDLQVSQVSAIKIDKMGGVMSPPKNACRVYPRAFFFAQTGPEMTPIKRCWRPQGRFLREFARTGSISAACRAAGLARRTVYRWRDADADFRARWENARGRAVERLRDEAMERALVGADRPVWHDGRIVDHVADPDRRVLWKLLQALQSETYGPRAAELRAKRERDAEFRRRLDEGEKRVAAYEADLRKQIAHKKRDADNAE